MVAGCGIDSLACSVLGVCGCGLIAGLWLGYLPLGEGLIG